MLEFISSHQTGAVSNKQHFCKYLTSAHPRETSLSICRTPRLLRRTRISEETRVQTNRKLIKTLQFLEFSRDFYAILLFDLEQQTPPTLRSLSVFSSTVGWVRTQDSQVISLDV